MLNCSICNTDNPLETNGWYKGRRKYKPYCSPCGIKKRRQRLRGIVLSIFSVYACSVCGYDKCDKAIEFHHRDPSVKEFAPSTLVDHKESVIRAELSKCDILCANCHREVHDGPVAQLVRASDS